ncbi:MAG: hypothetical protein KAI17_24085, partial [Thiotrichaceae bacterium]|nr:hypothetical protein [Thiotrichaceae bacterium]
MVATSKDGKNFIFEEFEGDDTRKTMVRTLKFAHKAVAGEVIIDLANLTEPPEMASNGFTNPNLSQLLQANVFKNRNDLEIHRAGYASDLEDFLSYTVIDSKTIKLNLTVEEGDVFVGRIKSKQSVNLSENRPIVASELLAEGVVDFVIGDPLDLNRFAGVQLDAFTVHRAKQVSPGVFDPPILQLKKLNNDSGADGNYHILDAGNGQGNTLRFEDAGGIDGDLIIVHGPSNIEREPSSLQSQMEAVSGAQNDIVDFINDNFDPETPLTPSTPTYIDLRTHGADVVNLKNLYDTALKLSVFTKTKFQTKILTADVTTDTDIGDLQFNNLTIGKHYRIGGPMTIFGGGSNDNLQITAYSAAAA